MTETLSLMTEANRCLVIRHLRQRYGWQQAHLASALGRSQSWVSAIERGSRNPSLDDLLAIFAALGVKVEVRRLDSEDA